MPNKPSSLAYAPAPYTARDVYAIQALAEGTATDEQQKRALAFIINEVSHTYDLSFRPGQDGDRETAFAEGRRFVGLQLVKLLNINPSSLSTKEL